MKKGNGVLVGDAVDVFSSTDGCMNSIHDYTLTLILPKKSMRWLKHFQEALHPYCKIECVMDSHRVDMFEIKRHIPWKISSSSANDLVNCLMTIGLGDTVSLPEQCVGKHMKLSFRMLVPSKFAYRIIGVRGRTVATMREQLGCDVFITEIPLAENKILCLVANTSEQGYLRTALMLVTFASVLFKSSKHRDVILDCAADHLTQKEMAVLKVMVESRQEQEMELQTIKTGKKRFINYQAQQKDNYRNMDAYSHSNHGSRNSFTMQQPYPPPVATMASMDKDIMSFPFNSRQTLRPMDSQHMYQYDPAPIEHHRQYHSAHSFEDFGLNFDMSKAGSFDIYYRPAGNSMERIPSLLRNPSDDIVPSVDDSSEERYRNRHREKDDNMDVHTGSPKFFGPTMMSNIPAIPFDLINS